MQIEQVTIDDFRVIEHAELSFAPGINLFWGDNGAGKTSVLEAIFVAARGRSFRHQEAGPFIRSGAERTRIVALLRDEAGVCHRLGIERAPSEQRVRFDGTDLVRRSQQVRALPIQLLTPNSHALIEGPPELRRRYLDIGLFHVEHRYQRWYADYQRALRQRNAALRTRAADPKTWDGVLSELALAITNTRSDYVAAVSRSATEVLADLAPQLRAQVQLRPGWDVARPLSTQLADRIDTDRRLGFTGIGPHRADIVIRAEQSAAAKRLSRGQQKLVVFALMVAQARLLSARAGVSPVLLLDDLSAELDRAHRDRVTALLDAQGAQCLITAVEADSLTLPASAGVFHVEQGGRLSR